MMKSTVSDISKLIGDIAGEVIWASVAGALIGWGFGSPMTGIKVSIGAYMWWRGFVVHDIVDMIKLVKR